MKCLAEVPDPRNERGRRYEWLYLPGVIVAAMMSGQRSMRGMAQWAIGNRVELIRCLSPRRLVVPSAATLYRVLRNVSVERLEACISAYTFDALHTRVKAAEEVLKHQGHYVMEVKTRSILL